MRRYRGLSPLLVRDLLQSAFLQEGLSFDWKSATEGVSYVTLADGSIFNCWLVIEERASRVVLYIDAPQEEEDQVRQVLQPLLRRALGQEAQDQARIQQDAQLLYQ